MAIKLNRGVICKYTVFTHFISLFGSKYLELRIHIIIKTNRGKILNGEVVVCLESRA